MPGTTTASHSSPGGTPRRRRDPGEHQARVACHECRKVKTRCLSSNSDSHCDRCIKNSLNCSYPISLRGKYPRKHRDSPQAAPSAQRHPQENGHAEASDQSGIDAALDGLTQLQQDRICNDSHDSNENGVRFDPRQHTSLPTSSARLSESLNLDLEMDSVEQWPEPTIQSGAEEIRDFNGRLHFKITHQIPPLGVLAETSMNLGNDPETNGAYQRRGMANNAYFSQSLQKHLRPRAGASRTPAILAKNIITIEESRELFKIYFEHCHPLVGLLDERICTPSVCAAKSSFLFTAVCAVAAQYYRSPDQLFTTLLSEAHREGMNAMFRVKSVCTVQGFLLLSWWNHPTKSYEDDNTYLYAGIAFRLAHEIGLHHSVNLRFPSHFNPTVRKQYELELLDRERTYRCCFAHDRVIMRQGGKPDSVIETNNVRSASKDWGNPLRTPADLRVAAKVELMQIVTRFFYVIYTSVDTLSGISSSYDFQRLVVRDIHFRLDDWFKKWKDITEERQDHPHGALYVALFQIDKNATKLSVMYICLARLLQADSSSLESIGFAISCFDSAQELLITVRDGLTIADGLKYAPDHILIDIVFCCTILLKLVDTNVSHMMSTDTAMQLVRDIVSAFRTAGRTATHPLALYADFLDKQLAVKQKTQTMSNEAIHDHAEEINLANTFGAFTNDLLTSNQQVADVSNSDMTGYAAGQLSNPFQPEHMFDNLWFDTLLSSQLNTLRPFEGSTNNDFWDLFTNPANGDTFDPTLST